MAENLRRTFVWHFDSPVEAVWPVLADTARFNEAAGLARQHIEEIPQSDGSVRFLARARTGPFDLIWDDQPVNWVVNHWFRHCRYFRRGPLKFLCASLEFFPQEDGCRGEYTIETGAANLFGRIILATKFFPNTERLFSRLATEAREFAAGRAGQKFRFQPPAVLPATVVRIRDLVTQIEATPYGHGLAEKLADFIRVSQEVDVIAIRPLILAGLWSVPPRQAIEVCLQAAKSGLLAMRWELLCPRCQIGKASAVALDQLPEGAHCPTCNIDYGRDFNNNIELVFQPSRTIREIDAREFCLFGPGSTPHVKVQLQVRAGEQRSEAIALAGGRYRLRTLEPGAEQTVDWQAGPFPRIVHDGDRISAQAGLRPGEVCIENHSSRDLCFIIEEQVWRRNALTAHQVTTLQAFRDLFDQQLLRPGDDMAIDAVTILFTDLKGSTALYERIGDSRAYHLVREHFAILGAAVRDHNGTLVKTIGDAVMAAFSDPADGLRCALRIQDDFATYNAVPDNESAIITLGLHTGRCIAVTLNNRLDYYGTAANKAARLEGQSRGEDIVFSPEFAADPAVEELLQGLQVTEEFAELKGFSEAVPLRRISSDELRRLRVPAG